MFQPCYLLSKFYIVFIIHFIKTDLYYINYIGTNTFIEQNVCIIIIIFF